MGLSKKSLLNLIQMETRQ